MHWQSSKERTHPSSCASAFKTLLKSPRAYDTVKEVLNKVPSVLDPQKPTNVDEADPYVLALGLELQRAGRIVRVLTDETRNRPTKMALNNAAGVLGLPAVTIAAFLQSQGL